MRRLSIIGLAGVLVVVIGAIVLYARGSDPLHLLQAALPGDAPSADSDGQRPGGGARGPVPVETAEAVAQAAEELFRTTAEVVADDRVVLTSEISGIVADIAVEDGARVQPGDTIVRFDDAEERADVAAAEAELARAEAALARALRLADDEFASQERVDQARAARETAAAELARAEAALEDQVVKAPFAGRIGLLEISPGAYLQPGQAIASLVDDEDLRLRLEVPQEIVTRLPEGAEVRIHPPEAEDPVAGKLAILAPAADPGTRSVSAEMPLPAALRGLRPGSFLQADVVVEIRNDAVFVPETALLRNGGRSFVFRVDEESRVHRVEVDAGSRRDGWIEVGGPIAAGDQVVAQGIQKVEDGVRVAPQNRDRRETDTTASPDEASR